jgi:hypothetical protein
MFSAVLKIVLYQRIFREKVVFFEVDFNICWYVVFRCYFQWTAGKSWRNNWNDYYFLIASGKLTTWYQWGQWPSISLLRRGNWNRLTWSWNRLTWSFDWNRLTSSRRPPRAFHSPIETSCKIHVSLFQTSCKIHVSLFQLPLRRREA